MKFFISGQIDDIPNVKNAMQQVLAAGHEITHNWTLTDSFLGGAQDKLSDSAESGRRAASDINGVVASDVYVLCSDNQNVGKGMYVELGAALALHQTTGKPHVYVVGKLQHLTVFYLHPQVQRRQTIQQVLAELELSTEKDN